MSDLISCGSNNRLCLSVEDALDQGWELFESNIYADHRGKFLIRKVGPKFDVFFIPDSGFISIKNRIGTKSSLIKAKGLAKSFLREKIKQEAQSVIATLKRNYQTRHSNCDFVV